MTDSLKHTTPFCIWLHYCNVATQLADTPLNYAVVLSPCLLYSRPALSTLAVFATTTSIIPTLPSPASHLEAVVQLFLPFFSSWQMRIPHLRPTETFAPSFIIPYRQFTVITPSMMEGVLMECYRPEVFSHLPRPQVYSISLVKFCYMSKRCLF